MNKELNDAAEKEAERRYPELIGVEKDTARKQRKNQRLFVEGAAWQLKQFKTEQRTDEAIEALIDIDFKLVILEDYLHGENGNTVTAIRGQLAKIIKRMEKQSALNNKSVGLDEKDKEFFDEMTKEEIWRKWQSDKKILRMYMYAMAHYGVTQFSDIKAVAELEIQNRKPQSK